MLAWQKAFTRLKKHAAAEWDDDAAKVKALFAPLAPVQAPVSRRNGKPAAPPPAPPAPNG